MTSKLKQIDQERYSRQILFEEIGETGQAQLAQSSVLVMGCGGLGSMTSELLTRAGIGRLVIVDRDLLDLSNLPRQSLFDEHDVMEGLPKAIAAKRRIERINSSIDIRAIVDDVNRLNVEKYLQGIDLVIDATDNLGTRYLLNEACIKHSIPWIYGSCVESYGQTMTIRPGSTPCFRCIFDHAPESGVGFTAESSGIISPIVHIIASLQSAEALKMLTGHVDQLHRSLIVVDVWKNELHRIQLTKKNQVKDCPVCNAGQYAYLSGRYGTMYAVQVGARSIQIIPFEKKDIDFQQLAMRLSAYGEPSCTAYVLRIRIGACRLSIFGNGRTIIEGTSDFQIARALFKKYVEN